MDERVFDEGFVEAYSTRTGSKQVVPKHYIGHPVLGRNLRLTPSAEAHLGAEEAAELEQRQGEVPTESWTHKQLDQYATDRGIDLVAAGAADGTRAEKVAVLLGQPTDAADTPVGDTPNDPA